LFYLPELVDAATVDALLATLNEKHARVSASP
jgi:hypothetical protein